MDKGKIREDAGNYREERTTGKNRTQWGHREKIK